jgi:His/Glu/Gln/Arg/opine family amino acid ABC transporter permease subunit
VSAVLHNYRALLSGIYVTVEVTTISMGIAVVIGSFMALVTQFGGTTARLFVGIYVEFFRGLPVLVLLFWLFYVLPLMAPVNLSPIVAGILGFSLNVSAFITEALRGSFATVRRGLIEAGSAVGMTSMQIARRIVLPLGLRRSIPIVGSIWVGLFKDSAVVSLVQVQDLTFQGQTIANRTFEPFPAFATLAIIYFVLAYPQARLVEWLRRREAFED